MRAAPLIAALARSLLSGDFLVEQAYARVARTLGRRWLWQRSLAARYIRHFAARTRPRHREVVGFLLHDPGFQRALKKYGGEMTVSEWLAEPARMQPVESARAWNLPEIESTAELAEWLSLTVGELEWFADLRRLGNKLHRPKLEHYRYRLLPKRHGGIRLTEMPKPRLKELQRRILSGILSRVPVHTSVHGFVKGRSIATFAAPHTGKAVVLRLDLQDFFPASPAARVQALFRTFGYPESVAEALCGICTNAAPALLFCGRPNLDSAARELYTQPHLPQGAPTSPALANMMAYRLDCRLSGLAKSAGAAYTRYADDLAFSGSEDFRRAARRFASHAAATAMEEGFSVNHRKTRIMRASVRQELAGVVVNQGVSLRREKLELLEAILTNCARFGPESQNRAAHPDFRAHLEGRIGYVQMLHPQKGASLRRLFDTIAWTA